MTTHDIELDERLRAGLQAAGEHLQSTLESPEQAALEARIVEAMAREVTARRATARRRRTWAVSASLALAACATLVLLDEPAPSSTPKSVIACPLPSAQALRFAPAADGRSRLELGPFGRVVLAPGAQARVVTGGSCELRLELRQGTLAAELSNLRPGTLRVQTALGDVVVHGTTFSVQVGDTLEVVLEEGAVALERPDAPTQALRPGQTLRRESGKAPARVASVASEQRRALTRLLAAEPSGREPPHAAAPDAAVVDTGHTQRPLPGAAERTQPAARSLDLLGAAEAARRQGDTDAARALYRRAAASTEGSAEIALLRHARLELADTQPAQAQALLAEHARRFPNSRVAAEASWLEVQAFEQSGEVAQARARARRLLTRFPGTPQARAAQALLDAP
jgi:hypothetical protein